MITINLKDAPSGATQWRVYLAWYSTALSTTDAKDTLYVPVAYPMRVNLPSPSDYSGVFQVITVDFRPAGQAWFKQDIVLSDGKDYEYSWAHRALYELEPLAQTIQPPEATESTPTQPFKWGWLVALALLAFLLVGKK